MVKKRLHGVMKIGALLLCVGLLYALFVHRTGLAIPCIFRKVTGWLCPGCGITHQCMALLRLDFVGAFYANPVTFVLVPVILLLVFRILLRYIKTGKSTMQTWENTLTWICSVALVIWALIRNIVG